MSLRTQPLSDLIDRLCIEVNKVATLENRKREEQMKPEFERDVKKIADWDHASRCANEKRAAVKNEIDKVFKDMWGEKYNIITEGRTF